MKSLAFVLSVPLVFTTFYLHPMTRQQQSVSAYVQMAERARLNESRTENQGQSGHVLRCLLLDCVRRLAQDPNNKPLKAVRDRTITQLSKLGYKSPNFFCFNILYEHEHDDLDMQLLDIQSKQTRANQKLKSLEITNLEPTNETIRDLRVQRTAEQRMTCLALDFAEKIVIGRARKREVLRSPEYLALEREFLALQEDFEWEANDNSFLEQEIAKQRTVNKKLHLEIAALNKKIRQLSMVDKSTQVD